MESTTTHVPAILWTKAFRAAIGDARKDATLCSQRTSTKSSYLPARLSWTFKKVSDTLPAGGIHQPSLISNPYSCIGGFSISIAYGLPVQRQHDSRVRFSGMVFGEMIAAAGSGKLVIHFISSLLQDIPDWMPGSGFKKAARDLRSLIEKLVEDPYQAGLELLVSSYALTPNNPRKNFV